MFSHVTVGTNNIYKSMQFYDAILTPLGIVQRQVLPDAGKKSACWVDLSCHLPRFYVYEPYNGEPASIGNGCMVAFSAFSKNVVNEAYAAGLCSGGSDEGPPDHRPHYGKGYYGAYLRDPDGNKVHIVFYEINFY